MLAIQGLGTGKWAEEPAVLNRLRAVQVTMTGHPGELDYAFAHKWLTEAARLTSLPVVEHEDMNMELGEGP